MVDDATDGDHSVLEMQACYAFNRTKFLTRKIAVGEGLIGQAFLEKETVYLKDIPDHFIRITSGLGEANPRYVLIVPLKVNDIVIGVAELASFREFDKHEIEFIETIGENIAHTFLSFRTSERTTRLLHESQQHAENMRSREEELRQNQEELQATQEEISRKYNALFKQLTELNYQSKFEQLKSITSTKKRNIEYYFGIIRSQIITFAENPLVIQGVLDFSKTFHTIAAEVSDSDVREMQASITKYYRTEFIPRLQDNSDVVSDLETFLPADNRTLALQYYYLSNNPHPTGKKSLLTQSPDGSCYSRVHSQYHTALLSFQEKFGYYDIFLIDAKTGDMLYSVFKEVDFGTNLLTGHYSQTNFGRLVKEAIDSKDPAFVKLVDFESYEPSYLAPASFIACPVYHENEKIGILVFQMPIHKINQILTGDHKWIEDGLGESGETCMVGSDYKVRSITRDLIVNKRKHLQTLKRMGYADHIIRQIDKMDTNILLEELKADSVRRALHGEVGAQIEKSPAGADMLTAFAPVEIADVKWVILSTMKEEEASMRINNLRSSQ